MSRSAPGKRCKESLRRKVHDLLFGDKLESLSKFDEMISRHDVNQNTSKYTLGRAASGRIGAIAHAVKNTHDGIKDEQAFVIQKASGAAIKAKFNAALSALHANANKKVSVVVFVKK